MANQIVLDWWVYPKNATLSAADAATALGAVVLYEDTTTDPVLGQAFGLTVAADTTAVVGSTAKRTLTLNMTAVPGVPLAPPPFPCNPNTPEPPELPYDLQTTVQLPGDTGSFTVIHGDTAVATEEPMAPSLVIGDTIQFASQLGVPYTVATVTPLTLTAAYTGEFANTLAFKVLAAPSTSPALYSSSPLDDAGGSGAQTVTVAYLDSLGGAGTATTTLSGKRPAPITLAGGTIDIASITAMSVASTGTFNNSVGQITLVDLDEPILVDDTDDEAQLKIDRALVYLPPSYFSLAQQNASAPQLAGDFMVSPDSTDVFTTEDQTGALAPTNVIQFASQMGVDYTVVEVTPKIVTLAEKYSGLTLVKDQPSLEPVTTGAMLVDPSPALPPTDDQIKVLLSQYVNPGNTIPPPGAPLPPTTMFPAPIFLSDLFSQTISLALAMPVVSSVIALS